MLAAVSSNEVWQKIVDFFTVTVKDFFVELLKENPPIKFILLVAGAALVLIGLIVIIAVCAKKNKAKKAAKKAARNSVKAAKKNSKKDNKVSEDVKPAVKETPVVPAPAPVAPVAAPAAPVAPVAPAPYIEDEKKFDAFDDELPAFEAEKPAPQEQIDMSKFIAEENNYDVAEEEPVLSYAEPAPAYAEPEEPASVEEKHYIEPENNDNFVDDSWGKAKINLKPKKAPKAEKTEEPEVAAEEPAPAPKKTAKKKAEVTEEVAPAKKAPAKKKATKVEEPVEEHDETEKPKVVGKYTIEDMGYAYQFHLYANNGQLLYESREYASVNSCKSGIATFKKNVADCEYRIDVDKNGGYKFIFKKGNSIYIGETYSTAKAAERSAESVKRFAQVSEIVE